MLSLSRHGSKDALGGMTRATGGGTSGKTLTGDTLGSSRHGGVDRDPLTSSRHGGGKGGGDQLNASRHGGGGGAIKNWGLLRNTVRAISGSTAQKEHGWGDTLGSSRHGGDKDTLSSSRHGLSSSRHGANEENEATVAMAGGGAVKNWGLVRNTVRAISGSTAQKEHGGGDTLGSSRHGGDKDALSSSRHGLSSSRHGANKTDEENEATVAMAALFPVKSVGGKDVSTASPMPSAFTKTASKKSLLVGSGFLPAEADEATVALTHQSSSTLLGRKSSFIAQPDFAEGDERAYSPAGKHHKRIGEDVNSTTIASADGIVLGEQPVEIEESEQMKQERLTKRINDLLRKK